MGFDDLTTLLKYMLSTAQYVWRSVSSEWGVIGSFVLSMILLRPLGKLWRKIRGNF